MDDKPIIKALYDKKRKQLDTEESLQEKLNIKQMEDYAHQGGAKLYMNQQRENDEEDESKNLLNQLN